MPGRRIAPPSQRARVPQNLTERLLDVLLDVRGVRGAFVVTDRDEVIAARFDGPVPRAHALSSLLEAVAPLRQAATSGLQSVTSLIELEEGQLFTRRFRSAHLCAWIGARPDRRGLEMTSRLVASSLPRDPRLERGPESELDLDDLRVTEPWLGRREASYPAPSRASLYPRLSRESLRPPRLPSDLALPDRDDAEPQRDPRRSTGVRLTARGLREWKRSGETR